MRWPLITFFQCIYYLNSKYTAIFVEKCENPLHCKGFSHFSTKISAFVIFMFEILTNR